MWQKHGHFLKKLRDNISDVKEILKPEYSLLDAGCCEGHMYKELGHKRYLGIDLFPQFIAEARRNYPEAKFQQWDIFDLSGSWDVVLASRVLIHIPDFKGAFEKLLSCTRKKLILFVSIGGDEKGIELIKGRPVYLQNFSRKTLESLGKCEIRERGSYATVIYDPLLP